MVDNSTTPTQNEVSIGKRPVTISLILVILVSVLFVLAASYEVTSLKSALTRMVKHFQGASVLSLPSLSKSGEMLTKSQENGSKDSGETKSKNLSFSITEENLNQMLSQRKVILKKLMIWEREVSSRLLGGNITLNTVNTLYLFGIRAISYPGFSDWTLAKQEEGFSIKLNNLKVMKIPLPFSPWLLSQLSRKAKDGWVYLRIPSRQVVEKVEISNGKLLVSGKILE